MGKLWKCQFFWISVNCAPSVELSKVAKVSERLVDLIHKIFYLPVVLLVIR